ncbi:Glutaminase A, partial [Pseudolycoriella hygida]
GVTASTIRPPAFPLAVRNPYTNIWLNRNELVGNWPTFWEGSTKGWTGLVRVDGKSYVYLGNPLDGGQRMAEHARQTGTATTPTQTHFFLTAGPVNLTVTFFSPVEIHDISRQSIPLSYALLSVVSNDAESHDVQVYMDISGEWASSGVQQTIEWSLSNTPPPSNLKVWTTQLQNQNKWRENREYAEWGYGLFAASGDSTHQSASDIVVRRSFINDGALPNTHDTNFRCVSCDWPVFGFSSNLGEISSTSKTVRYVVGNIRDDVVNWLGTPQKALWLKYWPSMGDLVNFFYNDLDVALETANALDQTILLDAFNAGGQRYADILAFSLRQSYGGNEFAQTDSGEIRYYQKEISSGAFMSTVDVIYPCTPMFIYTNITYLQLLLEPLFLQMESEVFTKDFAMHDIGDNYPNALGQGYGGDMPVEESANMILMVANIVFHPTANEAESRTYASSHYDVMAKWANYLSENCLYPVDQLSTDDFIGTTELNSGLALKGILGMKAFAMISTLVGNNTNAQLYNDMVAQYIDIWYNESIHSDGTHLKMEYNVTDLETYQFKYNALNDKLLNMNVVPQEIYKMEADYYITKIEPYGIPFVNRHDYTKSDWEMWTAAAFGEVNPELRIKLVEALGLFLRISQSRVPFSDWHVTATANQAGFQARPVVAGHFALLAHDKMKIYHESR